MPRDPYGQQFVLGAQAGANAAHFGSLARQAAALDQLIDALEAGHTPAERLYALANATAQGTVPRPLELDEMLARIPDRAQQKQAIQKVVVDGQVKASAKRAAERTRDTGTWRTIGGIRGPLARGGFTNNPLVAILTESAAQAGRETARNRRERERRLQRLSVGRRGALASRNFQPTGRTNRTGAKSVRPYVSSPNVPVSGTRSNTGNATGSGAKSGQQSANVPGIPGTRTNQAPTQRPVSRDAGALTSKTRTQSWFESQLSQQLSQLLSTGSRSRSQPRATFATRPASRPLVSPLSSSSTSSRALGATSPLMNTMTGQSLAQVEAQAQCKCPKPKKCKEKKKKKSDKPSCTNPQISKTIADGIITIKRKLKCPPSRTNRP